EGFVSVVGTDAFMDFVESIKAEGVELERRSMGEGTGPKAPLVSEIDDDNAQKDLDRHDIEIPILTPRSYREYKYLADLDIDGTKYSPVEYRQFSEAERRVIVFRDIAEDKVTHATEMDSDGAIDYRSVLGYFTQQIMRELR